MTPKTKRFNPWILLILLVLLFVIYRKVTHTGLGSQPSSKEKRHPEDEPFTRNTSQIFYSKHARCRMDCRRISEAEVQEVLTEGTVNYKKSQARSSKPRFALEDVTKDGQHVRIVFAFENKKMVVITCIDLGKDWPCDCN